MTTTTTTTIITDTTSTISVRQGAVMVLTVRATASGTNTFTLPGAAAKVDTLAPLGPYTYGPYAHDQDFSVAATGTIQASVSFTDSDSGGVVFSYVDTLPTAGREGVIYVTDSAAYWWNGTTFVPMGNGAAGSFTTLTASSLLRLTAAEDGLTAHAGGTKAAALALSATKNMHRVSVCATAADSVLLPASSVGQVHFIRNDGAESMQVFGAGTDTINGVATATGIAQAAAVGRWYVCLTAGAWVTT